MAVLVVTAVVFALTIKFVSGRITEQSESRSEDPIADRSPVACTTQMLAANMSARVEVVEQTEEQKKKGEPAPDPVTFTVTLRNTELMHPCYIQVGRDNATIAITSGTDSIVDLSTCEKSTAEHKQLLIGPDSTATFDVTWNGRRGDGCGTDAELSLPGTYKGVWKTSDATAAEATAVFELPDLNPAPPSEEESEG